jgi:site-specific recombinase XerD
MDVQEVLIDYLANIAHLTPGSQRTYRQHLMAFAQWCAAERVPLEQVNNKNVQRFLEWLKAKRKPHKNGWTELSSRTLAGYVRNIWTLLYWCLGDDEYQQYVKLQTVKAIKMPRP